MNEATGFQFAADPAAWKPAPGSVVRVPAGIRSKEKLIAVLADRLQFPAYSGRNWDAFEEALRDLSWLPPGTVTLVHHDLPFGAGGANRGIYLSILKQACRFWAGDQGRQLAAVFPASAAHDADSALASAEQQH
jgi:hypothetical protein